MPALPDLPVRELPARCPPPARTPAGRPPASPVTSSAPPDCLGQDWLPGRASDLLCGVTRFSCRFADLGRLPDGAAESVVSAILGGLLIGVGPLGGRLLLVECLHIAAGGVDDVLIGLEPAALHIVILCCFCCQRSQRILRLVLQHRQQVLGPEQAAEALLDDAYLVAFGGEGHQMFLCSDDSGLTI